MVSGRSHIGLGSDDSGIQDSWHGAECPVGRIEG